MSLKRIQVESNSAGEERLLFDQAKSEKITEQNLQVLAEQSKCEI